MAVGRKPLLMLLAALLQDTRPKTPEMPANPLLVLGLAVAYLGRARDFENSSFRIPRVEQLQPRSPLELPPFASHSPLGCHKQANALVLFYTSAGR